MACSRLGAAVIELIVAVFLILYSVAGILGRKTEEDVPFGEYQNLADCIQKNWNKRDPEQYCMKIRSKVEEARRRKYGY